VETDPELKRRLGGFAYVLTGMSRFAELSANRGSFRAEGFSWEGPFMALAIGNGRQAGGGVPLCPDALGNIRLVLRCAQARRLACQLKRIPIILKHSLHA
jgi:diacylglycerol kinase family enzyme